MNIKRFLLLSFYIFVSCEERNPSWDEFKYDYKIETYYNNTESENLYNTEYYNSKNQLTRSMEREEGCSNYIYNDKGILIEKTWSRNCANGIREIMMFDLRENQIGTFITKDSIINLDTVRFKQTKFYNQDNKIIKELEQEGNNSDFKHFEIWNYYSYQNGKTNEGKTLMNEGLQWNITYKYDLKGNLIQIKKVRNELYEIRNFSYDNKNELIKEVISSTENPITPETSFSAGNNTTLYKYDSKGFLTEEIRFNHKGDMQSKRLRIKK